MATKPQIASGPRRTSSNRDLAFRASHDVNGPLAVILAVVAFVIAVSVLFGMDWSWTSDFPTVAQTMPSPDINSTLAPAPANP